MNVIESNELAGTPAMQSSRAADDLPGAIRVGVARKRQEAEDICSFELVGLSGAELPVFTPGAHIDVRIPGDGDLVRQYSLSNSADERHRYVIAVLKELQSRGGSLGMHERVMEGDVLQISPPRNHFELTPRAEQGSSVLIAGGIGITPLLSMADHLARRKADFEFHYCARSAERMAFRSGLQQSAYADRINLYVDQGDGASRIDIGRVLQGPAPTRHLYVCGPEGFLNAVTTGAREAGWPDGNVHFEHFSHRVEASDDDSAFDVKLARSGRTIRVAADQTVVEALAKNGVELQVSCEQGVCGTCLTRVLEGIPDHKDVYMTPDEQARNDQFTPCCSRSRTPILVLDL